MLFKNNFFLVVYIVLFAFAACKKEQTALNVSEAVTLSDLPYGDDSRQHLDAFLPANRTTKTPVIILVHGGGFIAGDKADFISQSEQLAAKGFVVININYRLVDTTGITKLVHKASEVTVLNQVDDLKQAIKYVEAHSAEWQTSATQMALAGHSAGGTLALLYAYGNADYKIKAVANWAGATDMSFPDESYVQIVGPAVAELAYRATGYDVKNVNKPFYENVSPYWVLYRNAGKPTLNILPENNFVGGLDVSGKPQYDALTAILNQKNIVNKFIYLAGTDHGFSPGKWGLVIDETAKFFDAQFAAK